MRKGQIKFVTKLRNQGVAWKEVEVLFNKKFGTSLTHDNIRMKIKYQSKINPGIENLPTKDRPRHVLIIPDTHIPYHDRRAYNLMLQATCNAYGSNNIDGIVILGDYADFYPLNGYGKDASRLSRNLKSEVVKVNQHLRQLEELFPNASKTYIEGNHENRLIRYVNTKCPDLFGLVTIDELFQLGVNGWELVPYGPGQVHQILNSKLYARHEPMAGGVHVAHSTVVKGGCSIIFGHVHRIQESQVVMANGENHRGITCGWLGNKDDLVFNYVKNHHQWALGFSVVTVLPDGTFFNNSVHIIDYKCSIGGKVYYG